MTQEETITLCYNVPGWTWPAELRWLYQTARHSRSHLEIGTYCGRSALATAAGLPSGAKLMTVDNNAEAGALGQPWVEAVQAATLEVIRRNTGITPRHLTMDSMNAARQCWAEGLRFDTIFIDACHHYAEVKADIQAWLPMLKPGGIIAGHDYWPAHTGVMDAVNELFDARFEVCPGTRIWSVRT